MSTLNLTTVGDGERNSLMHSEVKNSNQSFRKDLYKKSLQGLNNSSIMLPTVDQKPSLQLNQSFDVVKDGKARGSEDVLYSLRNLNQSSQLGTKMLQGSSSVRQGGSNKAFPSVKILPVIGQEVNLDYHSSKASLNPMNSKVELTRKDVQNFLVNGSISKEFIHQNKKELQKFIRNQARSTEIALKGYQEYGNNNDNYDSSQAKHRTLEDLPTGQDEEGADLDKDELGSVDITPSLKRKLLGPATIHVEDPTKKRLRMAQSQQKLSSQRGETEKVVFSQDVRVEKKFKGERSQVSDRVLETWINETLTDAYHLEIPGVLTQPAHKNPVHRYGIDRQTLVDAGLSTEEVDRIYRSLFVYSVGFFELLKKILATTQKNYQIITTIWKVYQVLLEYCCKTDYRILIAEITDKHHSEIDQIEKMFKSKIQGYIDNEKIMRQNMETMRGYNDQLEKDRANEKQLRLKLEEEYMQNTKNHEEEVKLRLKFEGKFNTMHDTHRELQIRHERTLKELRQVQMQLKEAEDEAKVKSLELVDLQKLKAVQDTQIEALNEYKKSTMKELKQKNYSLMSAQQAQSKAIEDFELKRYEVQESLKDLNDIKTKMEVQVQEIEHLKGVIEASKLEKEEVELARLKIKGKYQKVKLEFEERVGKIDLLAAELESVQQAKKEYFDELDPLRKKFRALEFQLSELQTANAENHELKKQAVSENKTLHEENLQVQNQIKKMNADRHRLIKELEDKTELAESLEQQRDMKSQQIAQLYQDITRRDQQWADERRDQLKKQTDLEDKNRVAKERIDGLLSDIDFMQIQNTQLSNQLNQMQLNFHASENRGKSLDTTITEQISKISKLTHEKQEIRHSLNKTQAKLNQTEQQVVDAEMARDDAVLSKIMAEEVRKTYEEALKDLRRQIKEEKARCRDEFELVYATCKTDNERDMMHAEEVISRFGFMKETLESALIEKQINADKIANYDNLELMLVTVETQRDQVIKELNDAKGEIDKLETKLTDKDAEIENIKEGHKDEVSKTQQQHNIEVNELEQKIQKERVTAANLKSESLKKQREDQSKISELQRTINKLELAANSSQNTTQRNSQKNASPPQKKAGAASPQPPRTRAAPAPVKAVQTEEKGCQTDPIEQERFKKRAVKGVKRNVKGQGHVLSHGDASVLTSLRNDNELKGSDQQSQEESSIQLPSASEDKSMNKNKKDDTSQSGVQLYDAPLRVSSDEDDNDEKGNGEEERDGDTHEDKKQEATVRSSSRLPSDLRNPRSSSRLSMKSKSSDTTKKAQLYMQWLIDEERQFLLKLERSAAIGENIHPNQLKIWRSEMRIPAMFFNIQLTEEQLKTVEQKQKEQAEYIRERALRKIEEGSEYSSDYEEIEKSDYVSTDGEGANVHDRDLFRNIKVIRGDSDGESSFTKSPDRGHDASKNLNQEQKTGGFGGEDQHAANQNNELKIENGEGHEFKRVNAADKMINLLRAQSARQREMKEKMQQEVNHEHLIDDQLPVTQYIIVQKDGKDVYKRRIVVNTRVEKQRDDEYREKKARALSARNKKVDSSVMQQKEKDAKRYRNMFSNFAENYSKTLEKLVKQSKEFMLRKAENRRQPGKNDQVQNIRGRSINHFLIEQMKESSSWQIHLQKLREELHEQENKWDHREEDRAEIERKREEIRLLEELEERDRSRERREKLVIVREDLRIKAMQEEAQRRKQAVELEAAQIKIDTRGVQPGSWQTLSPKAHQEKQIDLTLRQEQEVSAARNVQRMQQSSSSTVQQHQMQADLDQMSVWSEDQLATALSQRDAQNPQGEEEEMKASNELQLILQSSQQHRSSALLDSELQSLTKGGVAAVNREQQQLRIQQESQMHQLQADAQVRAQQKDIILMQNDANNVGRKPEEKKKKPAKLGPSTIRTLIRAADSRAD